ncbi:hypothetical protein I302_107312 [Kwoniella bestiolae CBS 10118]|uniref:F-box domain-containing protein n=1 Tax=Kwoniella bestiolae CBS 10118 TaxID=1296100 RepID=A0A1B9FYW9_9TREE|nr:hypothetical protein I302_06952 [Kwoniella bestiolae CBS 10118]OCF23966.1 hypothetical protein I302_06952 [Kwoniella bestiolae CBS 10118]
MLTLPDDLLEICLARLPPQSIIACASTCKRINDIIATSTVIQLKLNQLLYDDETAFEDFEPTRSEYHLGENRKVLCVHGEHIAVGLDKAAVRDPEVNREGKYTLFDLKHFPTSNSPSTPEAQSKTFKVSFRPDSLVVDISKDLVIVMDRSHQGFNHLVVHVFKVFSSHDQPEYQGAEIMDLGPCFSLHDLRYALIVALGPKDTFTARFGASIRIFCWQDGAYLHSIDLPVEVMPGCFLSWVGSDLMVIRATMEKPLESFDFLDDWEIMRNHSSSFLFVYQVKDFSRTSAQQPLLPALFLSLPAQFCDFPPHIREMMSPDDHLENLSDL